MCTRRTRAYSVRNRVQSIFSKKCDQYCYERNGTSRYTYKERYQYHLTIIQHFLTNFNVPQIWKMVNYIILFKKYFTQKRFTKIFRKKQTCPATLNFFNINVANNTTWNYDVAFWKNNVCYNKQSDWLTG